ncbi:hypothetical protein ACP70R_031168 [Stipagrostis hirtigluma subsp. patula]
MTPAGGGDEMAGGPCVRGGVDRDISPDACRNLGRVLGSRKRKAAVMPPESDTSMGNEEDSDESYEESWRISKEIENLRSQLAKKKKELRYSQENKKLKVELALKAKETECLRKQNEELEAKNEGLQNNILIGRNSAPDLLIVDILDSQIEARNRHLLQLERWKKTLELSNALLEDENRKLHEGNTQETCCIMNPQIYCASQIAPHENNSELHSMSKEQDSSSKSPDEASSEMHDEEKNDDERFCYGGTVHQAGPYKDYLRWLSRNTRLQIRPPLPKQFIENLPNSDDEDDLVDDYDEMTRDGTQPERAYLQNYIGQQLARLANEAEQVLLVPRGSQQELETLRSFMKRVQRVCRHLAFKLNCVTAPNVASGAGPSGSLRQTARASATSPTVEGAVGSMRSHLAAGGKARRQSQRTQPHLKRARVHRGRQGAGDVAPLMDGNASSAR